MAFYIKKEVHPREARQLHEHNRDEIMEWCSGKKGPDGSIQFCDHNEMAKTGDYIMKDYSEDQGWHFYPVNAGLMEENYKKVLL